jgi:putative membrane protein insertion efficiency factor
MVSIIKRLIRFYQAFSRYLFPKICRFHPSCSQYAMEVIEKHGVIKGSIKAMGRILRCSPLFQGGYDPVR